MANGSNPDTGGDTQQTVTTAGGVTITAPSSAKINPAFIPKRPTGSRRGGGGGGGSPLTPVTVEEVREAAENRREEARRIGGGFGLAGGLQEGLSELTPQGDAQPGEESVSRRTTIAGPVRITREGTFSPAARRRAGVLRSEIDRIRQREEATDFFRTGEQVLFSGNEVTGPKTIIQAQRSQPILLGQEQVVSDFQKTNTITPRDRSAGVVVPGITSTAVGTIGARVKRVGGEVVTFAKEEPFQFGGLLAASLISPIAAGATLTTAAFVSGAKRGVSPIETTKDLVTSSIIFGAAGGAIRGAGVAAKAGARGARAGLGRAGAKVGELIPKKVTVIATPSQAKVIKSAFVTGRKAILSAKMKGFRVQDVVSSTEFKARVALFRASEFLNKKTIQLTNSIKQVGINKGILIKKGDKNVGLSSDPIITIKSKNPRTETGGIFSVRSKNPRTETGGIFSIRSKNPRTETGGIFSIRSKNPRTETGGIFSVRSKNPRTELGLITVRNLRVKSARELALSAFGVKDKSFIFKVSGIKSFAKSKGLGGSALLSGSQLFSIKSAGKPKVYKKGQQPPDFISIKSGRIFGRRNVPGKNYIEKIQPSKLITIKDLSPLTESGARIKLSLIRLQGYRIKTERELALSSFGIRSTKNPYLFSVNTNLGALRGRLFGPRRRRGTIDTRIGSIGRFTFIERTRTRLDSGIDPIRQLVLTRFRESNIATIKPTVSRSTVSFPKIETRARPSSGAITSLPSGGRQALLLEPPLTTPSSAVSSRLFGSRGLSLAGFGRAGIRGAAFGLSTTQFSSQFAGQGSRLGTGLTQAVRPSQRVRARAGTLLVQRPIQRGKSDSRLGIIPVLDLGIRAGTVSVPRTITRQRTVGETVPPPPPPPPRLIPPGDNLELNFGGMRRRRVARRRAFRLTASVVGAELFGKGFKPVSLGRITGIERRTLI